MLFLVRKSGRVTTQSKQLSMQMYVVCLPLVKVLFFPLQFAIAIAKAIYPPLKPPHPPQPSATASSQSVPWHDFHKVFCDMTVTDASHEAL